MPENNFSKVARVLASFFAHVKQLIVEKFELGYSTCPKELARSANTKLSAHENPTESLFATALKIYSRNFVRFALHIF